MIWLRIFSCYATYKQEKKYKCRNQEEENQLFPFEA